MSDYTNTFDGAGKESRGDAILGADVDTELDNIATAIATKVDKPGSPTTGDLFDQTATGGLAVSGVAAANLTGLTSSLQEQIDGKWVAPSAATNHTRAGPFQIYTGGGSALTLSASDLNGTYTTIGPTSSGLDHEWSVLDDVPSTARALLLVTSNFGDDGAATLHSVIFWVNAYDGANVPTISTLTQMFQYFQWPNSANDHGSTGQIWAPCDSNASFAIRAQSDFDNITEHSLSYRGFIG